VFFGEVEPMPVSTSDRIISAQLPHDLIVRLREAARESDRTISGQLRRIVREWAESGAAHQGCREDGGA
jgi:hypothetical protein